jgi:hypothetical protein
VDFKRIGSSLVGVAVLLGLITFLASLIFHGAVAKQQQPGTLIVQLLLALTVITVAGLVICAVITAFTEQQISKAVLPAIFGIAGAILTITNSQFGFSALVAAVVSSYTVFGGEKVEPVWQKNTVMIFGLLAIIAYNVGLTSDISSFDAVSMIGLLLGVPAFLFALVNLVQSRQWGWAGILLIAAAWGPFLVLITRHNDVGLLFLPLTAIAAVRGLTWNEGIADRHTFGTLALLAFIMIIGGGTLINSVFSTVPNQPPAVNPLQFGRPEAITFFAGADIFLTAGMLGFISWIFSFIYAGRHAMWGWFAAALLLPGVGAILLGFFGPTPEDFKQTRTSAAAKRAAGA